MRIPLLILAATALQSCGPAPVTRSSHGAALHQMSFHAPARCHPDPELARQEALLLQEINNTRASFDLAPVRRNHDLATASHEHACANAKQGAISHTGPGGTRPGHRALRAGYDYKIVAENLGLGFHSAPQAMFYWMRSPGHRTNILKPEVRDAALGLTLTERGQRTWVLMLGRQRGGY